jgi:adenylosuccinate synthase
MRHSYVVVGLGAGDESKGAAVDYLCRKHNAGLVVRYCGGAQCGHRVVDESGREHVFAQYGSGSFTGAATYLDRNFIVDPIALARERQHLLELGLHPQLSVHPDCLVVTPYHQAIGQARQAYRQHGTCGQGIGVVREYWLQYGTDALTLEDLDHPEVTRGKLELMRQRFLLEARLSSLTTPIEQIMRPLRTSFRETECNLLIFPPSYNTVVFEGAQGVLLDENYGFHPHTTWSTTTPYHALEQAVGDVRVYGVTRTYLTRHGAGPLPTEDPELTVQRPDPTNPYNPWQGNFRCGFLDLPLLDYAAGVCAQTRPLDGLIVTHTDAYPGQYCHRYENLSGYRLPACIEDQEANTRFAASLARPQIRTRALSVLLDTLNEEIAPIEALGNSPCSADWN